MKTIGIVGFGIMGSGIANNFLKNGYTVYVWNRSLAQRERFQKKGAIALGNPREVAERADIVFEVTAHDQSSRQVWLEKNGILAGANKKTVLIANATLSVEWIDRLIQECQKRELQFLDMPMTGGRVGAETGQLVLLVGGDEKLLDKIKPDLKAIAAKVFYFGPAGHGIRYKLILNALQAVHMVGFGEAIRTAQAAKMNLKRVSEALIDRPGGVITALAWQDYQSEPNPINFSIEWITKDLTYAKQSTKNLDLPLLEAVLKQYQRAVKKGLGKKDWARINNLPAKK